MLQCSRGSSYAENDNPKTIIGYSNEHTLRPGGFVDVMVNAVGGENTMLTWFAS